MTPKTKQPLRWANLPIRIASSGNAIADHLMLYAAKKINKRLDFKLFEERHVAYGGVRVYVRDIYDVSGRTRIIAGDRDGIIEQAEISIRKDDLCLYVVAHEMLHAAGLIDDEHYPYSVMFDGVSKLTAKEEKKIKISGADRKRLRKVYGVEI